MHLEWPMLILRTIVGEVTPAAACQPTICCLLSCTVIQVSPQLAGMYLSQAHVSLAGGMRASYPSISIIPPHTETSKHRSRIPQYTVSGFPASALSTFTHHRGEKAVLRHRDNQPSAPPSQPWLRAPGTTGCSPGCVPISATPEAISRKKEVHRYHWMTIKYH